MAKIQISWERNGFVYGTDAMTVGAVASLSEAAPDFGNLPGDAVITVLEGAVHLRVGATVTSETGAWVGPGKTTRLRLRQGQQVAAIAGVVADGSSLATAVSTPLAVIGNTAAFSPVPGKPINVSITGNAAGLQARSTRSFDSGATWLPITVAGQPYGVWTGNVSEQAWVETEAGVLFRVEITAIAGGAATIRISQ